MTARFVATDAAARLHSLRRATDGSVRLRLEGAPGLIYTVEASRDFVLWYYVAQVWSPAAGAEIEVVDNYATNATHRFYRARTRIPDDDDDD